ncbi:N-acetyltransferase family protein [Vibrio cidicii]|uniref:GNAT family N-acetyltransferase n=1 Tax=Vibrio cidicii TaxID=1763883 RepID=UPI003F513254
MNDFTISPAQPNDIDALNDLMFALHDEHHQQCPEFFKTAEEIEQEKSIARYLDDPECLVFVAKRDEEVIGFVSGHFCELISTVSQPLPMGSVDELFVVNAYRHQGIAQTLLQKIEQTFTDYGVSQVFVEVWHFNQSAIALYQKSGFQHHIHWLRKALTSGK